MTDLATFEILSQASDSSSPATTIARGERAVVIFPGTLVNAEMPESLQKKFVNGMIRHVNSALERSAKAQPATIYCARYSKRDESIYIREHIPSNQLGNTGLQEISADARDFVYTTLLPIMGATDGHIPTVQAARAQLSKLTIVSHSAGTMFAKEVSKAFHEALKNLDYSDKEITDICHEVTNIALANGARIKPDKAFGDVSGFRTFSFQAQVDFSVLYAIERLNNLMQEKYGIHAMDVRKSYEAAGYDFSVVQSRRTRGTEYVHTPPAHAPLQIEPVADGVVIRADAPSSMQIKRGDTITTHNQASMHADFARLQKVLFANESPNLAQDGKPLIMNEVTPEHHPFTFINPTDSGNRTLVKQVDTAIANAVARSISQPRSFRNENQAMLKAPGISGPAA